MKTKSKKINLPMIIIFYLLAAVFFIYGAYMVIYSVGYVNAYQGSSTVAIENSIQYIVSSSVNYFGFSFLLLAAAIILSSFNKVGTVQRIEDVIDKDDNYDEFDQLSMDDLIEDTGRDDKRVSQPQPKQEDMWEPENLANDQPEYTPKTEAQYQPEPEYMYAPEPMAEPASAFQPEPAAEPASENDSFVEANDQFAEALDMAFDEPDEVEEFKFEPEEAMLFEEETSPAPSAEQIPVAAAQPEPMPMPEPAAQPEPMPMPQPVSEPEDDSNDEIMVEQVKLEKRQTPVKRDNISSTMIKDIFEKK